MPQGGTESEVVTMDLQIDESGSFTIARVTGELNAAEADRFVERLHDHACGAGACVAIDLSRLSSIDSSGLAALINLVARARAGEGQVVFVAPTPFVAGIFNVTRLDSWLDICDNIEEARRQLSES